MDENLTIEHCIDISNANEYIILDECMEEVSTENDVCYENTVSTYSSENIGSGRIKFAMLLKLRDGELKNVLQLCMELSLISSKYSCPKCDKAMKLLPRKGSVDGFVWSCDTYGENSHRLKRSVRKGTIFNESKMSLVGILMIIHSWVYKVPYEWVFTEISCSRLTLKEWNAFCRNMCVDICTSDTSMIGGEDKVIEIVGGPFKVEECMRKNKLKGKWVFSGFEKGSCRSFFKLVEGGDKNTFFEVIKSYVLPGTTIFSDLFSVYDCWEDEELTNLAESNLYIFDDPEMGGSNPVANFRVAIRHRMPKINKDGSLGNTLGEYVWRKKNAEAYDKMKKFLLDMMNVHPPNGKDY